MSFLASSSYTRLANFLVVEINSTLRRFWIHDVLCRQDDLDEYARLVQELGLGNDSFHRYFWMSTKQFDYVLGLVGPHILRLPTVYVAVHVQGRTTSYDVLRTKVRRNRACLDFCISRRTASYVVVRRGTQCERHLCYTDRSEAAFTVRTKWYDHVRCRMS